MLFSSEPAPLWYACKQARRQHGIRATRHCQKKKGFRAQGRFGRGIRSIPMNTTQWRHVQSGVELLPKCGAGCSASAEGRDACTDPQEVCLLSVPSVHLAMLSTLRSASITFPPFLLFSDRSLAVSCTSTSCTTNVIVVMGAGIPILASLVVAVGVLYQFALQPVLYHRLGVGRPVELINNQNCELIKELQSCEGA